MAPMKQVIEGRPVLRTRGREAFRAALESEGITQAEAARRLGFVSHLVSGWLRGDFTPSIRSAIVIHRVFGVPIGWWGEDI